MIGSFFQELGTGRIIDSDKTHCGLYLLENQSFQALQLLVDFRCDACEFAKHTRTSYPSNNNRNTTSFMIVHFDVWDLLIMFSLLDIDSLLLLLTATLRLLG